MTLVDSVVGTYVEILHNLTHAIAADSVNCLDVACDVTPFLTVSTKCFFFKWRGEQGAPLSAFTISSKIFCNFKANIKCDIKMHLKWSLDILPVIKPIAGFVMAKQWHDSFYYRHTNPIYRKEFHSTCKRKHHQFICCCS